MESAGYQEDCFFSDLLKEFRKRKKLTQSQLANRIEASREAVSLWERGEYKPETTRMVDALVLALDLNDEEKRLLFEAYLGTASVLPLHNFPEHNPYFTGRETILKSLHAHLTSGKQVALTQMQAISGLGGIGKTQVAIEYASRFREHYHDILWAVADSRETLMTSYLTLAQHLRLREREEREQSKVIEAVKRWLREHKGWLLILDNIEDLGLVREFVPSPRQGAVVLTTRREETRPVAQPLALDVMVEEEGIIFLLKRAGRLAVEVSLDAISLHDMEAAKAIVHAVGGLPLALDQAGAYVAETKCSLFDYLTLFKREQKALLERRGAVPSDHPQSVTTTFTLAFEQVQQKNESALDLLRLCAFFHPDAIPEEMIAKGAKGAKGVDSPLQQIISDPLAFNSIIEILSTFSLIRRNTQQNTLSLHRLIQAVLKDEMDEGIYHQWAKWAVCVGNVSFPEATDLENWSWCQQILSHVETLKTLIEQEDVYFPQAPQLLNKAGDYLYERGLYVEAEAFFQCALDTLEQHLGPQHLDTARSLYNLARVYWEQGRYTEAELLTQRALTIREQLLGSWHPDTIMSMSKLMEVYSYQGKYAKAEQLELKVLTYYEQKANMIARSEKEQIRYYIGFITVLNDLGWLYHTQGRYTEAESLLQRALNICEQQVMSGTTAIRYVLSNLGMLYRDQGKLAEAETLLIQTLTFEKQHLGLNHPAIGRNLDKLGKLYYLQGRFTEAEQFLERALMLLEQHLRPQHLYVADALNDLGILYCHQGRYLEAEALFKRVLEQLGSQHPQSAHTFKNLAMLYLYQKQYVKAEAFFLQALNLFEQHLPLHPSFIEALENYIYLLRETHQEDKAVEVEAHAQYVTSLKGIENQPMRPIAESDEGQLKHHTNSNSL